MLNMFDSRHTATCCVGDCLFPVSFCVSCPCILSVGRQPTSITSSSTCNPVPSLSPACPAAAARRQTRRGPLASGRAVRSAVRMRCTKTNGNRAGPHTGTGSALQSRGQGACCRILAPMSTQPALSCHLSPRHGRPSAAAVSPEAACGDAVRHTGKQHSAHIANKIAQARSRGRLRRGPGPGRVAATSTAASSRARRGKEEGPCAWWAAGWWWSRTALF
jgi:hypothetical protein